MVPYALSMLLLLLASSVSCDKVFHAPIHLDESRNHEMMLHDAKVAQWSTPLRNDRHAGLHRREMQEVINPDSGHRVELWDGPFPVTLITAAALGNPPQPFRMIIDMSWDTLFVPSAMYSGTNLEGLELFYYKNRSSTYRCGCESLYTVYSLVAFDGQLSIDEFRIAGLSIPNQPFINADRGNTLGFIDFYFGYEGALGLAPRWNTSVESSLTPSPWSLMVNQSLLGRNMFTLELPRGPQNVFEPRTGTISFGGIGEKYANASFDTIPLSNYSDKAWIFEAQSVYWTNKTHPIHHVFVNRTLAGIDSSAWYLGLPGRLSDQIRDSVPHECGFFWCFVDCDDRKHMPNLTFEVGWQNFTMTAEDYAPELFVPGGGRMCSFELVGTNGVFPVDAIVLGKQFLSKYYSVFNLDDRQVMLTQPID